MSKLYAVTAGCYSDYHIVALCSDKNKAEKIAACCNDGYFSSWDDADVCEFEDGIRMDLDRSVFEVNVSTKFTSYGINELFGEDKIAALTGRTFKINEVRVRGDGSYNVYVLADDADKALKIARDLVAEYKAGKEGVI